MTSTMTPYRSELAVGSDNFAALVRSEWTKLRTVRGWVLALVAAVLVTVGVGVLTLPGGGGGGGGGGGCAGAGSTGGAGSSLPSCRPVIPTGPGGMAVTDRFTFVHQPLAGDGSITVRVSSLGGQVPIFGGGDAARANGAPGAKGPAGPNVSGPGLVPWAKAGLMVKAGTTPGSTYAAVMLTGAHGVRMQHDFVHDTGASTAHATGAPVTPTWLRLTRSGSVVSGFRSGDGVHWTAVDSVRLSGAPASVEVGMFVASPQYEEVTQGFGGTSSLGGPSSATAVFDRLGLQGLGASWRDDHVGSDINGSDSRALARSEGDVVESAGSFTVTGNGDVAPAVGGLGANTVEQSLVGAFAGLIFVIVVGAMFITAEYRRRLVHVTFAATPRRGRVLAAKAVVLGGVTFAVGLVAATTAYVVVGALLRDEGGAVLPLPRFTEVRLVVGTAALMAVVSVFTLAVGTLLRRSSGTVALVVVLVVLPYILAVASVLPAGPAQWLLRITPAAAFAIQQGIPAYPFVTSVYVPTTGYFPLSPWLGFTVLLAWTAAALAIASASLNRRDA